MRMRQIQSPALAAYPVGSVYISTVATSPADLFGGTWERIQDMVLMAAGAAYGLGTTGGAAAHKHTTGGCTLTVDQIPSHTHSVGAHAHTVPAHGHGFTQPKIPNHVHTMNHGHSITDSNSRGTGWDSTNANGDKLLYGNVKKNRPITEFFTIVDYSGNTGNPTSLAACTGGTVSDKAAFNTNNSAAFDSGSRGGGSAHSHGDTGESSNLPPYIAVNVWKRTA